MVRISSIVTREKILHTWRETTPLAARLFCRAFSAISDTSLASGIICCIAATRKGQKERQSSTARPEPSRDFDTFLVF